jgi:hypothetical protein
MMNYQSYFQNQLDKGENLNCLSLNSTSYTVTRDDPVKEAQVHHHFLYHGLGHIGLEKFYYTHQT